MVGYKYPKARCNSRREVTVLRKYEKPELVLIELTAEERFAQDSMGTGRPNDPCTATQGNPNSPVWNCETGVKWSHNNNVP